MNIDFTNYPHDLSSDEVILLLSNVFPNAKHGTDYWVCHYVSPNSSERTSPAFIAQWNLEGVEPSPRELAELSNTYSSDLETFRYKKEREALYPVKLPVEFRSTLNDNGIYRKAVETLIDNVSDPALNDKYSTYWEYTDWFRRDDEFVIWLASALGKSPAQFDAIWLTS